MATKAEQFRAAVERSQSKPHGPVEKAPRKRLVNRSTHLASRASFRLEETVGRARPSRKSTRKAANRIKPDSNLELRQQRSTHSPEARARKASARKSVRKWARIAERVAPGPPVR